MPNCLHVGTSRGRQRHREIERTKTTESESKSGGGSLCPTASTWGGTSQLGCVVLSLLVLALVKVGSRILSDCCCVFGYVQKPKGWGIIFLDGVCLLSGIQKSLKSYGFLLGCVLSIIPLSGPWPLGLANPIEGTTELLRVFEGFSNLV